MINYDIISCTGCQACRIACPKQAIEMRESNEGHIYPYINTDLCIECNKCVKVCPAIEDVAHYDVPKVATAIWIKDKKNRKYSTSGGIAYLIAKKIIERGGYYCGVVYCNGGAEHKMCSEIKELPAFQGSKYTHSNVKDVYKETKALLNEGKEVLFSGTACQIAALYKYLNKKYENLYTIDILCHGVPSLRILREHIEKTEKANNKKIDCIRFREKRPDQLHSNMNYIFTDKSNLLVPVGNDTYFRCFVENYALRPNCFSCKYANSNRIADITLADFWGYSPKAFKFMDCKKGVSLFLSNTAKGETLLNLIKDECIVDKRSIKEAQSCNRNLVQPQPKPKNYDIFWQRYLNGENLDTLSKEYFPHKENDIKSWLLTINSIIKIILIKMHVKH